MTAGELINGFVFGEEFQFLNRGQNNEEFVRFLYKSLFAREGTSEEVNTWMLQMDMGMSKVQALEGFTNSQEFAVICEYFGDNP